MTWEVKRLGDVLSIERGGSPRPIKKYLTNSSDGINWIKISDATASEKYIYETKEKITRDGLHKTRIVNDGDFILSNSMSFGRPYIMKTTGCIHDGWLVLKQTDKKLFETDFLYYLLSSSYIFQQFDNLAAGSTVRNLNIALVSSVKVPIPPLPEQLRIVAILDSAFENIARAKEGAEQNLKNANEIFESYLQSVFENKGEGWEEKKLQDLSNNYKKDIVDGPFGSDLKRSHYLTFGVPVLKLQNVKQGRFELKNLDYVSPEKALSLKRHAFHSGDIVMTKLGAPLGVSAIVQNMEDGIIVADLVRIRAQKINTDYLCYFLNSPKIRKFINSKQKGTTRPRIRLSVVRELPILFPKNETAQQSIVQKLNTLSAETKKLEAIYTQKLADLEELKKSILQKAFNGELK